LNATKDSISKADYKATPNLSGKKTNEKVGMCYSLICHWLDVRKFTWPSSRSSGVHWI
jgi:hypothetical protein